MWRGEANFPDSLALRDGPGLSPETGHDRPVEAPGRWSELPPPGSDKPGQIKTQSVFFWGGGGAGVCGGGRTLCESCTLGLTLGRKQGETPRSSAVLFHGFISAPDCRRRSQVWIHSDSSFLFVFPSRYTCTSRVILNSQGFAMFILRRSESPNCRDPSQRSNPSKGKPPLHEWKHSQPGGGSALCDRLLPLRHL